MYTGGFNTSMLPMRVEDTLFSFATFAPRAPEPRGGDANCFLVSVGWTRHEICNQACNRPRQRAQPPRLNLHLEQPKAAPGATAAAGRRRTCGAAAGRRRTAVGLLLLSSCCCCVTGVFATCSTLGSATGPRLLTGKSCRSKDPLLPESEPLVLVPVGWATPCPSTSCCSVSGTFWRIFSLTWPKNKTWEVCCAPGVLWRAVCPGTEASSWLCPAAGVASRSCGSRKLASSPSGCAPGAACISVISVRTTPSSPPCCAAEAVWGAVCSETLASSTLCSAPSVMWVKAGTEGFSKGTVSFAFGTSVSPGIRPSRSSALGWGSSAPSRDSASISACSCSRAAPTVNSGLGLPCSGTSSTWSRSLFFPIPSDTVRQTECWDTKVTSWLLCNRAKTLNKN